MNKNSNFMLVALLLAYTVASLAHFAHNAIYLHEYPNMPSWLTVAGVWWAWVAIAIIGAVGYVFMRRGWRTLALSILAIYAVLGFGGLEHYVVAPASAHSTAMNLSIVFEAGTALMLLAYIVYLLVQGRGRVAAVG